MSLEEVSDESGTVYQVEIDDDGIFLCPKCDGDVKEVSDTFTCDTCSEEFEEL